MTDEYIIIKDVLGRKTFYSLYDVDEYIQFEDAEEIVVTHSKEEMLEKLRKMIEIIEKWEIYND